MNLTRKFETPAPYGIYPITDLNLLHGTESSMEAVTVAQPVKKFPSFYGT
jgi:hypothetical protein